MFFFLFFYYDEPAKSTHAKNSRVYLNAALKTFEIAREQQKTQLRMQLYIKFSTFRWKLLPMHHSCSSCIYFHFCMYWDLDLQLMQLINHFVTNLAG